MEQWEVFKQCQSYPEAQAEADFLAQNGVPAKVETEEPISGTANVAYILVPSNLLHRARWIMTQQQGWTENELAYFATGQLDDDKKQK